MGSGHRKNKGQCSILTDLRGWDRTGWDAEKCSKGVFKTGQNTEKIDSLSSWKGEWEGRRH